METPTPTGSQSRPTSSSSAQAAASDEQTPTAYPSVPIATVSLPQCPDSKVPCGDEPHEGEPLDRVLSNITATDTDATAVASRNPSHLTQEPRRDSGLAPSAEDNKVTVSGDSVSIQSPQSIPSIVVDDEPVRPSSRWSERKWNKFKQKKSAEFDSEPPPVPDVPVLPFQGISMDIPTGDLEDLNTKNIHISKRGSVQLGKLLAESSQENISAGGQEVGDKKVSLDVQRTRTVARRIHSSNSLRVRAAATRAISADEELLSRRVRLLYERGDEDLSEAEINKHLSRPEGSTLWEENQSTGDDTSAVASETNDGSTADVKSEFSRRPSRETSREPQRRRDSSMRREKHEIAGGLEDWSNLNGEVDRYGFIIPRRDTADSAEPQPLQRVSTSLLLASETPRRKQTLRRNPTMASSRSFSAQSRTGSVEQNRPTSSQSAYGPGLPRSSTSRLRHATNKLPHNRGRRFRDEAGDMLTSPDGMESERDDAAKARMSQAAKKKEWEREDKWTKMAKPTGARNGGGMSFEFDTHSSKLIERTWKGIPDRWRATAWHAFLSASAKKRKDSPTDEELIEIFYEFQEQSSPDDVQIDIDVPRTINSHIMFRRRYRGGQRLLFRVLHAMSLYYPETGYVQGMAALAATLLAYYDEEHAFVMIIRLWQLRGLDRLYRSGFAGLMEALDDFEKGWLAGGEVASKLSELGIPPTAYGTRWYLTLFNYSIPFPAQLRVWDVFMLLGDADEPMPNRPATRAKSAQSHVEEPNGDADCPGAQSDASPFGKSLDVLHATSAALIDGMREIILESDFENSMKVLTSWVPIKDVDLFMRVARAEWKVHRKKKGN